jgi:hypothetical protein
MSNEFRERSDSPQREADDQFERPWRVLELR